MMAILFAVETAKELGAKSVGLVAPYLSYMRQDKRFKPGEALTSNYFASLMSNYFDWMVTIDPHLHRHHSLDEIYSIPTTVVHAAPAISKWIMKNIEKPLVIGPDMESEQWVSQVAKDANAPFLVLEKVRRGDRDVEVSHPDIEKYKNHTPVLVDDIISTARTMMETVKHIVKAKMKAPVCIGVHAIFSGDAYEALEATGTERIVSCNTIIHKSNEIDLSEIMVKAINEIEKAR
jgi:ribose-phosphate pyrophosphokinase